MWEAHFPYSPLFLSRFPHSLHYAHFASLNQTSMRPPAAENLFRPPAENLFRPPAENLFRPPAENLFRPPAENLFRPPAENLFFPHAEQLFRSHQPTALLVQHLLAHLSTLASFLTPSAALTID